MTDLVRIPRGKEEIENSRFCWISSFAITENVWRLNRRKKHWEFMGSQTGMLDCGDCRRLSCGNCELLEHLCGSCDLSVFLQSDARPNSTPEILQ